MNLKLNNIIVVLIFLIPGYLFGQGYVLENKGTIKNNKTGVIKVKGGQVKGLPDSLGGRVEFLEEYPMNTQEIPNIIYNQLVLRNPGRKWVDSLKSSKGVISPLITIDSLIVDDSAKVWVDREGINAKASVKNTSIIRGNNDVRLINDNNKQEMEGAGHYSNLNIDNPQGVDIVDTGGFKVNVKLELTRGELRNEAAKNFSMSDSSTIVRHTGASLKSAPQFDRHVNVQYTGGGPISTGPEIPDDTTSLLDLAVENTGGITMSKSFTVNRNLYVGTMIYTDPDPANRFVLSYTSLPNPAFGNNDAEIAGSFRRKNLQMDSTKMIFNNPYSYIIIPDSASGGGLAELTSRIYPHKASSHPAGDKKVVRDITITGKDKNYNEIKFGMKLTIGYGWRNSTDLARNETNGLVIDKLILQRWSDPKWFDIKTSEKPVADNDKEWAYSYATVVTALGDFVIGMPEGADIFLNARVFLEGPYRFGSMALDLNRKNLIPKTPPDYYPYNLDPIRSSIAVAQVPDSVVDWIVLEFRNSGNSATTYITCFLKNDGTIVDIDGRSRILLSSGGVDSGDYYMVVRHRNHLSVITADPVRIYPETANDLIDFTDPGLVMGGTSAMKPLEIINGKMLFGMFGGVSGNYNEITERDWNYSWNERDLEDYLISDYDLSGIVTTRDLNVSWNNRGKKSNVAP